MGTTDGLCYVGGWSPSYGRLEWWTNRAETAFRPFLLRSYRNGGRACSTGGRAVLTSCFQGMGRRVFRNGLAESTWPRLEIQQPAGADMKLGRHGPRAWSRARSLGFGASDREILLEAVHALGTCGDPREFNLPTQCVSRCGTLFGRGRLGRITGLWVVSPAEGCGVSDCASDRQFLATHR